MLYQWCSAIIILAVYILFGLYGKQLISKIQYYKKLRREGYTTKEFFYVLKLGRCAKRLDKCIDNKIELSLSEIKKLKEISDKLKKEIPLSTVTQYSEYLVSCIPMKAERKAKLKKINSI